MLRRILLHLVLAFVFVSGFHAGSGVTDYKVGSLSKREPQPVYSANLQDAWNRIFYLLFTRTIDFQLTDDFTVEGPFESTDVMGNPELQATTRTFQRVEGGDRAIDPLYPNFFSVEGSKLVLTEPGYTELKQALQEALNEPSLRPPLERALMQADVWAASEILSMSRATEGPTGDHARALLPMLEKFIAKLALSSSEIAFLPHNYALAEPSLHLPPLFDENGGWMEVEWLPERSHDSMGGNRHASRIFLKPTTRPEAFLGLVNERIRKRKDPLPGGLRDLDGAALVTQVLLIDRTGRVAPSPLISDLQLRTSSRDKSGSFKSSNVEEFELSRQLMLANPSSGGFIRRPADEPAYLPASGNDFSFASPMIGEREKKPAVLGTLRRRCESCHFEAAIFTFLVHRGPRRAAPQVRKLSPAGNQRANYVADKKMNSREFQLLHVGR